MTKPSESLNPLIYHAQNIAEKTHGIVTASNVLDGAAFIGAYYGIPVIDTWPGYAVSLASYGVDFVDGPLARITGTTSKVGDYLDHIGDKPKLFYGAYHLYKRELADRPLIAAIGLYNSVTAAATLYDRRRNTEPQITADETARRAFFGTSFALGLQVAGHNIARTNPELGRKIKRVGNYIGYGSLVAFGVPNAIHFWKKALNGPKKSEAQPQITTA